jgi:hypothetical protein
VNLTVTWRFLLYACELIHIFVRKDKICNNYAENIRRYSKNLLGWGTRHRGTLKLRFNDRITSK